MSHWTSVLTSLTPEEGTTAGGLKTTTVTLGGEPHTNALVAAVARLYLTLTDREPVREDDLSSRIGQKVSLLVHQSGAFGHQEVQTIAGTLQAGKGGGVVLLPKRSRTKGYSASRMLEQGKLLDLEDGFAGEAVLRRRTLGARERLPTLRPLTREDLQTLPEERGDCEIAVFGSYPFPDGTIHGAIWLLYSYLPEDDIVEGVLLAPPGSATSEHGSVYGRSLLRMSVGRVEHYPGTAYAEAIRLTDASYEDALAALTPEEAAVPR